MGTIGAVRTELKVWSDKCSDIENAINVKQQQVKDLIAEVRERDLKIAGVRSEIFGLKQDFSRAQRNMKHITQELSNLERKL